MVVDDGRAPRLDGLDQRDQRGILDAFHVQREVQLPPEPLEDFDEIRRRLPRGGKAAREGGIQVVVRVDQPRHGDAAVGVEHLRVRRRFEVLAHGGDFRPADEDFPVGDEGLAGILRDDKGILDEYRVHVFSLVASIQPHPAGKGNWSCGGGAESFSMAVECIRLQSTAIAPPPFCLVSGRGSLYACGLFSRWIP